MRWPKVKCFNFEGSCTRSCRTVRSGVYCARADGQGGGGGGGETEKDREARKATEHDIIPNQVICPRWHVSGFSSTNMGTSAFVVQATHRKNIEQRGILKLFTRKSYEPPAMCSAVSMIHQAFCLHLPFARHNPGVVFGTFATPPSPQHVFITVGVQSTIKTRTLRTGLLTSNNGLYQVHPTIWVWTPGRRCRRTPKWDGPGRELPKHFGWVPRNGRFWSDRTPRSGLLAERSDATNGAFRASLRSEQGRYWELLEIHVSSELASTHLLASNTLD